MRSNITVGLLTIVVLLQAAVLSLAGCEQFQRNAAPPKTPYNNAILVKFTDPPQLAPPVLNVTIPEGQLRCLFDRKLSGHFYRYLVSSPRPLDIQVLIDQLETHSGIQVVEQDVRRNIQ